MRAKRWAMLVLVAWAAVYLPTYAYANAIPVVTRSAKQDGTVRVRLDTLGSGGTYSLSLSGSYRMGDKTLPSGASVTVRFVGGRFTVTASGATEDMGAQFSLIRQGDGGVKIAEASAPSNVYPGDIEFLSRSGVPYVICHVFIEDYLDGVVPYEMSNTFPLEALKAQAITARTYALRRMASASGNYYDLRDTTSDQVYRGSPSGNAVCKEAVDATEGLVLMYGDAYCAVYYSSSNGGQTESAEHAWGGSGYPYYGLREDPYDLANPSAVVRKGTVYTSYTSNTAALRSLLESALLSCGVYGTVATIESVMAHSPRYAPPSRLYTQLRFDLRLTSGQAASVDLPIFGGVDGALGMSMSSLQNELVTVETISNGFRIMARRYGHGVGLSQYGAQQMAGQGLDYLSILGFYFEGATLVRHAFTHGSGSGGTGGGSTATPTPGPGGETGQQATVTLSNVNDRLNLRGGATTDSPVIARIPHGTVLTVYGQSNGWASVRYGGDAGYVSTQYLRFGSAAPTPEPGASTAVVTLTNGSLNLRDRESVAGRIITTIPNGGRVTVLAQGSAWTQVGYGGSVGYVMSVYLRFEGRSISPTVSPVATPSPTPPPSGGSQVLTTATVQLNDPNSRLNLRSGTTGASHEIILGIPHGARVDVYATGNAWSEVSYQNRYGYVSTQYLRFEGSGTAPTPGPTPAPSAGMGVAYVKTLSGSGNVNLRVAMNVDSESLARIAHGQTVTLLSTHGDWYRVRYGGLEGYIAAAYLSTTQPEAAAPVASYGLSGQVINRGRVALESTRSVLNLRSGPREDATAVLQIEHGEAVEVLGYEMGAQWAKIRANGVVGYASVAYLKLDYPMGEVRLSDPSSTLALRKEPFADADSLAKLPHGTVLTVLDSTASWRRVRIQGGIEGYVHGDYLTAR